MTDEATTDTSTAAQLDIAQPSDASQGHAPLGEVLLAARNAKELTQKDVSNNLRLSIKQINALESNEFSILPDAMITRGFIRNYARFLDVDAEPLLASYRVRVPDTSPVTLSVQSSMRQVMSDKDSQPWLKYILGSILVLLFLLAWFFYMDYMPKPVKHSAEKIPEAVVPAVAPSTEISLPEIALPAAERQPDTGDAATGSDASSSSVTGANADVKNTVPAVVPNATTNPVQPIKNAKENIPVSSKDSQLSPIVAVNFNASKASTEHAATQAALVQTSPVQATPNGKAAIKMDSTLNAEANNTKPSETPAAAKKVNMAFSEQTWVSVTNKSGKVIYEKMLAAGSADGFDGEPPLKMVIGNAKATKLMFLGKQIDLASSTKSNVAHLTLE